LLDDGSHRPAGRCRSKLRRIRRRRRVSEEEEENEEAGGGRCIAVTARRVTGEQTTEKEPLNLPHWL
jgi:hypothetical protein